MNRTADTPAGLASLKPPVLIAHRGDKTRCPENTMASFEAAIRAGAWMIELDIALSRDRQLVVIHDDTVDRTTNGTGTVCDLTLADLKSLDAGSWFDSRFNRERIPTLEEVLKMVDRQALVNIEIKKSAFEDAAPEDAIEKQLMRLIADLDLANHVLISSFETRLLERIAASAPGLALGAISLEPADEAAVKNLEKLGCYSWHGWCETMTGDQIELMHSAGFKVFSFTVNEPDVFERLVKAGVDGVFTDDCSLFQKTP